MVYGTIGCSEWEALEDVLTRDTISFAVLYGSHSVGESTAESDIDIGIKFTSSVDTFTELFRIEEEYADMGFDDSVLDLTVLNEQYEEQFISTVREQSVLICGDIDEYQRFTES